MTECCSDNEGKVLRREDVDGVRSFRAKAFDDSELFCYFVWKW